MEVRPPYNRHRDQRQHPTDALDRGGDAARSDADQFEYHNIRAVGCTGEDVDPNNICGKCKEERRALIDRFHSNVELREGPFAPNTRHIILERSVSLQKYVIEHHRHQSDIKSKRLACRGKVIEQLLEKTGMDVKVNKHSDFVFTDDTKAAVKTFLERGLERTVSPSTCSRWPWRSTGLRRKRMQRQSGTVR